ncbi:MAG: dipeptide/oligopeptide/nickel ABC transporter permease/ATP-binding protein [Polyangiales bacterium]
MSGPRAFALSLFACVLLVVALTPLLPLPDPDQTELAARLLSLGSPGHPLGTDALGRDLLARLLHGTRLSLAVATLGVVAAAGVGSAIGLSAAYAGGLFDVLAMRFIDVLMAFPYMLLALGIVAVLGPGLVHAGLAVAIANVAFFARSVRGQALGWVHADFIAAARLGGASHARIIVRELLPNVLPVLLATMASSAGWMLLETAGLSFLGLGAQPPTADLGGMLGQSRHLLSIAPHVALLPGLVIFVLSAALNLLGDRAPAPSRRLATLHDDAPPAPRGAAGGELLLDVRDLTVSIAGRTVLHEVNLVMHRGERIGLVGESGSGKSTLARALLGLLPHDARQSGEVLLEGRPLVRASGALGYVPQDPQGSLHPLHRVRGQLREVLALEGVHGRPADARALELLTALRMPDPKADLRAYPHALSGGMRQRVAVALSLARAPRLLVADEPTTALDVTLQAELLGMLRTLSQREKLGLLFISHDLAVVAALCDRVLVMRHGQIVEDASVTTLLTRARHPYTRQLVAASRASAAGWSEPRTGRAS